VRQPSVESISRRTSPKKTLGGRFGFRGALSQGRLPGHSEAFAGEGARATRGYVENAWAKGLCAAQSNTQVLRFAQDDNLEGVDES
jgi:hypothetical protein